MIAQNKHCSSALEHLNILDLTHRLAGPYCTKLLAGFGANVIKIEMPQFGDPLRRTPPFYKNNNGVESSIPFLWLNTGKKSVTLNLKHKSGKTIFKELIAKSDVVVENFSPRVMSSIGLDYKVLRSINPKLIMASISNFGQTGPYRDYKADEITLAALSGQMDNTGSANNTPLTSGPALNQYTAGMHAYIAILMAIIKKDRDGTGQHIDIAIFESAIEQIENRINSYLRTKKVTKRGAHVFAPWGTYPCADGYATIIGAPFRNWKDSVAIFEEPSLFDDRFEHARDRVKHRKEIDDLITPWISKNTRKEIFRTGQSNGLSFSYLSNLKEATELQQHKQREFFTSLNHPSTGAHMYADAPFKMPESPWKSNRAPKLGEHNNEVICGTLAHPPAILSNLIDEGAM